MHKLNIYLLFYNFECGYRFENIIEAVCIIGEITEIDCVQGYLKCIAKKETQTNSRVNRFHKDAGSIHLSRNIQTRRRKDIMPSGDDGSLSLPGVA